MTWEVWYNRRWALLNLDLTSPLQGGYYLHVVKVIKIVYLYSKWVGVVSFDVSSKENFFSFSI